MNIIVADQNLGRKRSELLEKNGPYLYHIIFVDVVGFSKNTTREQRYLVSKLNDIIKKTSIYNDW